MKSSAEYSDIERFVKSTKTCLLITYDGDREVSSRIAPLLGTKIGGDMLAHTEKFIKAYDITSAGKMRERGSTAVQTP